MSESDNWRQDAYPKVAGQIDLIRAGFQRDGIKVGVAIAHGGIDYLHQEGSILVRDEDLRRVEEIVGGGQRREPAQRVIKGVALLPLTGTRFNGDDAGRPGARAALAEIDRALGAGVATPNHVLTVAHNSLALPPALPPVTPCPATEPEEVMDGIEPEPGVCPGNDGAGVLIYIADTGLLAGAHTNHPWLNGVSGEPDPLPAAEPGGTQPIPPYTGHGTFVAGLARCLAPAAEVFVANVFDKAGSALESDAVAKLGAALNLGVDIFNLSIAAVTRNDLPLLAFEAWLEQLRRHKGIVCVVPAGNNATRRPNWPAAFPDMISVGALAGERHGRAQFSNYGGWVDVYAPGRGIINAYASGTYTCHDDPYKGQVRNFYGMARWSGTSFSAPIVTGLIAARMSRTGENGQDAASALLARARSRAIHGVGAVLRPCLDDNDTPSRPAGCHCAPGSRRP